MKRVQLDFAPRTWSHGFGRVRAAAWLCVAGLCAVVLVGGAQLVWLHVAWLNTQAELVGLAQSQQRETAPRPSRASPLTLDQQKAFNRAIVQLNQPWPVLLDALERATNSQIALLSLNFEPASQRVRGSAEAKNFPSMMAFIERLNSGSSFHSAQLVGHLLDETTPMAPIRFEFAVEWRGAVP